MPAVKGKGRKTPAKGKRKGGGRRKKPQGVWANVKDMSARVWEGVLTYTAVGFAALAVVVVLMLFAGGYFWNISERVETLTIRAAKAMGFSVERVTVKGATYLSDRDIMQSLWDDQTGSILGRSLLNVDAQDARQKIENLAWVEYAAVQKLWPNTVHVSVRERKPQAMWQDAQGQFFLIDQKGTPLEQVSPVDYTKLPLLTGTDSPNEVTVILASLQRRPALYERVAVIVSVGNGRRFDLRFRNDFTAKLPEEAIAASLDRLEALGAGTGKLAESLDYIDLRDPKWAYYKPKSR